MSQMKNCYKLILSNSKIWQFAMGHLVVLEYYDFEALVAIVWFLEGGW